MHTLLALAGLLIPSAHAQIISGTANEVSGGRLTPGPGTFPGIVDLVRGNIAPILSVVAIFLIIRAGLKLINSQDEGKLETAKRTIASALVGLMLIPLSDRIFNAIYNSSGYGLGSPADLTLEIGGIIDWALVLLIPIAILMIVVSGIRAVASFGKDEGAATVRQTVYGVVVGIGLLLLAGAIKATLGLQPTLDDVSPVAPGPVNVNAIITRGVDIVINVLQFIALIAVAIIIYAGILMILNFGNDEQFERAKGIIFRAIIGLLIILLGQILITFIVNAFLTT